MPFICPYCRSEVTPETGEAVTCAACGTPHHRECYEENGGCTLFGCKLAPPDDPKVHVTTGDVAQVPMWGSSLPTAYGPSTGFGDVNAPLIAAPAVLTEAPPPPPPPPGAQPVSPVSLETFTPSAASTLLTAAPRPPKARLTYILLGIFLGSFGVHNFYAGYVWRGMAQLGLTLATMFYGAFVTWIWALIEVCTVDRDHNNVTFC